MRIIFAVVLALAGPAAAGCAPTMAVYRELVVIYGQSRLMRGLAADGHMVEIWAGRGAWTILDTSPAGVTCTLAQGVDAEVALAVQG